MLQPPIHDYALIGDGRSAALVSRAGSIDWLCWPRFDSPSLFGTLLDPDGGRFSITPTVPYVPRRRYVEETNVLETRFETEGGVLVLTDLFPVAFEEQKRQLLLPDHELLRSARCVRGEVPIEIVFDPRPDYGRASARIVDARKLGFRIEASHGLVVLLIDVRLERRDRGLAGRHVLRAGEAMSASLTYTQEAPAVLPVLGDAALRSVTRSIGWWKRWSEKARYDGPYRSMVVRSALALKLLGYAPSGAIVAAPTASLPERIGGPLNWDYRYCWLRDAAFTARALFGLGYHEEAEAWVAWLIHTTRLTRPKLHPLYDVFGNPAQRERELALAGYRGSRPVRIGNAARVQRQLDVYGEVIDAATQFAMHGGAFDRVTAGMLTSLGVEVCRAWREPDEGIWEVRTGRRCHTHSLVLAWTALDRLLALGAEGHLPRAPTRLFEDHRAAIRRTVEERAWNRDLASYAATLGGDEVDASLLLMPWYGFEPAASPRMQRTYARTREELGAEHGLFYRYRAADAAAEGTFGACCFWAAEYLALGGGSLDEAYDMFDSLLSYANDLGLYAEEIDPDTGQALGNFPQAFTHVGLINAALSLRDRERGRERQRLPRRRRARRVPRERGEARL